MSHSPSCCLAGSVDRPSSELAARLEPLRKRHSCSIEDRLRSYDEVACCPPPHDDEYGTDGRVAYEREVRWEVIHELRKALVREARQVSPPSRGRRARVVIVAFMAVHITQQERLTRLAGVLASIADQQPPGQDAHLLVAISWYADAAFVEEVASVLEQFAASRATSGEKSQSVAGITLPTTLIARQGEQFSQFQHLQAALEEVEFALKESLGLASQGSDWTFWAIFGDDDDLWHRRRVAEVARAIHSHRLLEGVGLFATMARANVRGMEVGGSSMPLRVPEVDALIKDGSVTLLSDEEVSKVWLAQVRQTGEASATLRPPGNHGLEYFDLCPRLRILREFFTVTSPFIVSHSLCDLRFRDFLMDYPIRGEELGLEVSFFEPNCWMYFYAHVVPTDADWDAAIEGETVEGQLGRSGHVSSKVKIAESERQVARRSHQQFARFDRTLTLEKLTRCFAFFRYRMEVALIKGHTLRMDQRDFDATILTAAQSSFVGFAAQLSDSDVERYGEAIDLMCCTCRAYAKTMLEDFGVGVLWFYPDEFIYPPSDRERVSNLIETAAVHLQKGCGDLAVNAATEAVQIADMLADAEALGAALLAVAEVQFSLGQRLPAKQAAQQALPLLKQIGDESGCAAAQHVIRGSIEPRSRHTLR